MNRTLFLSIHSKRRRAVNKLKAKLSDDNIIITKTKYSTTELKKVSFEVYDMFSELKREGAGVLSSSIDEELGKVIVKTTSMPTPLLDKLQEKYGDILDIIVDKSFLGETLTFARTDNMTVLGGGIAANNSSFTIAATAKNGTDRYLITVGHALTGNGTTAISQNTTAVGVDWAKAGSSHDIGLIKVTASGRTISNKILRNSTTAYDYKYTSTDSVTQGSTYCKAGIATGYQCSEVLSTSYSGLYQDTIQLKNPNWTFQNNGDSGSPLINSSSLTYVLYGVMSTKSTATGLNAFATATKISYFNYYWPSYSLYTSDTPY